ncbi:uncharacterized protein C11orf87 homolog isoform X1 [Corvus kubaryi]|uniref:uncharacterized protein C11orf87 homolog isoform X1 n=1 Tax=Corvus kubaryi TaxID=68294 RepID=UPI001C052DE1|nr:uncharacterized protein C11orf87 homolog isoform X1 [Corvus kubaryi]
MGSSFLFVLEENACDALSLGKASFHTYSHQGSLALLRSHRFTPASPGKDGCAGWAEGRGFGTGGSSAPGSGTVRTWLTGGCPRQPRGEGAGAGSVRALWPRRVCVAGATSGGAGCSRLLGYFRASGRLSRQHPGHFQQAPASSPTPTEI